MTRPTGITLALPPGTPILLPAPPSGLACVGVDPSTREVLFAGQRPDGQWPSAAGWLPGGPGNAGVDDSGWRLLMRGLVDIRCQPGAAYGRGTYVGQVADAQGIYVDLAWLEDFFPDRLVHIDPALFIAGLSPSIAPVALSGESAKIPALVSNADGSVVRPGSVTVVDRGGRAALVTNGIVVQVGDIDVSLGLTGGANDGQ